MIGIVFIWENIFYIFQCCRFVFNILSEVKPYRLSVLHLQSEMGVLFSEVPSIGHKDRQEVSLWYYSLLV